jgi:hypothetical protein
MDLRPDPNRPMEQACVPLVDQPLCSAKEQPGLARVWLQCTVGALQEQAAQSRRRRHCCLQVEEAAAVLVSIARPVPRVLASGQGRVLLLEPRLHVKEALSSRRTSSH